MATATTIYAAGPERLAIDVAVTGTTDPTALTVETCLDPAAATADGPAPVTGWQAATWDGPRTVVTHLITGTPAGTYGLWWRIDRGDEAPIVWAGTVTIH